MPPTKVRVSDDDLARIRGLLGAQPKSEPKFTGITRIIDGLYDELLRNKAEKNWTWAEVAKMLTDWGYQIDEPGLLSALARVRKKRAAQAARPSRRAATTTRRHAAPHGLSVISEGARNQGSTHDLVKHGDAPGDMPPPPHAPAAPTRSSRRSSSAANQQPPHDTRLSLDITEQLPQTQVGIVTTSFPNNASAAIKARL